MTFRPTPAGRKSHLPAKRPKSSQASGSAAEGIFSAAEGFFSASADPSLSDRRGLQNRESADHDTPNKPPPKGDPFPTRKAQNLLTHIILPLFQMAEFYSARRGRDGDLLPRSSHSSSQRPACRRPAPKIARSTLPPSTSTFKLDLRHQAHLSLLLPDPKPLMASRTLHHRIRCHGFGFVALLRLRSRFVQAPDLLTLEHEAKVHSFQNFVLEGF